MAGLGFQVYKRAAAGADPIERLKSVASTQYTLGDLLTVFPASGNKGQATQVTAADKATHLYQSMITPDDVIVQAVANKSTARCEKTLCVPVSGGLVILKSWLVGDAVPPINKVAANANSTATQVLVTAAGSSNDYLDGTVYIPELGEQRPITADSVSTGVHTFTVDPAFSRAPTTGDTVIAIPWGRGATAVKFNATTPHQCLDTSVANKTGGQNEIIEVDLKGDNFGPFVLSICPDRE